MHYSPYYCSLSHKVSTEGSLDEPDLIILSSHILGAMVHLHSHRVIHRDIKASNILYDASTGNYKLCDLGSALLFKETLNFTTEVGKLAVEPVKGDRFPGPWADNEAWARGVKGTCNWMAPEIMMGGDYGSNVDCWSLACTLIEAGTGKLPWRKFDNQLAASFIILQSHQSPFIISSITK
jgi:mitogen-activated protein kinase kinase 2